jgi:hypothetical protein
MRGGRPDHIESHKPRLRRRVCPPLPTAPTTIRADNLVVVDHDPGTLAVARPLEPSQSAAQRPAVLRIVLERGPAHSRACRGAATPSSGQNAFSGPKPWSFFTRRR